jgi:hypothetical protein
MNPTNSINSAFRQRALGPFFWLFLFRKLPLAFLAGVKMKKFDDEGTATSLKFRWINQNPFKSMYFAAMQMAAELATGLLLFQFLNKNRRFSMLLVHVEAKYSKKAVGTITFYCSHGKRVEDFIASMIVNAEGQTIVLPVLAVNEAGEEVGEFKFTWSCRNNKARK